MTISDGIVVVARTKLADRPVVWHEAYTKRTLFLKKQFHDIIGPGSYFRFEGHDSDTNDDYCAVIGPAKVHSPRAKFFAGVRKQPSDYALGGEEYHDMKDAMEHASETWGIPVPKDMRYYDSNDLKGLSSKVDKWKEEHGDDHDEQSVQEWYDSLSKEDNAMPMNEASSAIEYMYVASDVHPFFIKIAMPQWLRHETGFQWWDIDDVIAGTDSSFNMAKQTQPSLDAAKNFALNERTKRRRQIADFYGPEYVEADFYKIWLAHRPDKGTYIIAVGPYCGKAFEQAQDKFGVFKWKLNLAEQSEIDEKVRSLMQEYADKYGVQLSREDLNVPLDDHPMVGEITINKSGRAKIYGSPEWKRQILDRYGVQPGHGMTVKLKQRWSEEKARWKQQLDAAYAQSQESGEAFEHQQPPPPSVDLSKRAYGQQIPTTIYRQDVERGDENLSLTEKVEKYGFDSIQEAVDNLNSTVMQGAPVGDVPPTTTADLAEARAKHNREKAARPGEQQEAAPRQITRQRKTVTKPEVKEPAKEPAKEQAPEPEVDVSHIDPTNFDGGDNDYDPLIADTARMMNKMAADLAKLGKTAAAEGIRSVVQKNYGVRK